MMHPAFKWLLALAVLGIGAVPLPVSAHGNHNTATSVICTPNPVVRGTSTNCTMRVEDTNASQQTQPAGTLQLYRGSVAAGNLVGTCTALGIPNQVASSCQHTYTPTASGSETLIAHFVNTGTAQHQWRTSTGDATASRGSTVLTISPAPAASLRVVTGGQPTNTVAGTAIQRSGGGGIQVEVLDTLGDRLTSSTLSITIAIQTNAGGGTLSGTATVAAVAGVATFTGLSINKAGIGYRLRATAGGVTGVTTNAFNITAAAANRYAFAQQPVNTVAGETIGAGAGVTVRVEDQFGNVVNTDNTTQVTVAILVNPGGGTLSGTLTRTMVNGVASFTGLSINRAGVGYTLQATGTLTAGSSVAFNITAGPAAQIAFTTPPVNTVAGAVIGGGGGVVARVQDAHGNLVAASTAPVTVALAANPGMAVLQGTLTVNAIAGVATFSNLVINKAAAGYTMSASAPALVATTSAAFSITAGAATKLAFGQPPTNNEAVSPITPAITVRIEDANGNLVNDTRTVTLAFAANPGSATLGGTLSRAAVNGVATFNDISVDVAAAGYTLVATTTGGLTPVTSQPFTIGAGTPTRLEFVQQPTNANAGALIAPAVTVRILDSGNNLVAGATNAVTLAFANNPSGGALSGTTTVNAVNGVASFSTLSVNLAGTGFTLQATASSLASDTSSPFDVTVAAAAALKFVQQPTATVAGQVIAGGAGGVTVRIEDASGNLVTGSTASVTLAIDFDAGGGTTLNGTKTVNAVNGIATFPNLSINTAGTGYTLRATATGLATAFSNAFNITHTAAAKLAFGVHPANTPAGGTITPAVTVRVLDQYDNLVANSTASVVLTLGANPGSGTLGGNTVANAVNGVASFGNLFINAAGAGYTLTASTTGLSGATSNAFNIATGSPAKLAFLVMPSNTQLLATITPAVQVAIQDSLGNTITGSSAPVSLVLFNNPGGGELGGTVTLNAVNGIATFSNLSLDRTGTGYSFQANSSGLSSVLSNPFNITAGPPARLAFAQQPMNAAPGTVMAPWPSVQVQDAAGNPVTSTIAITITRNNPGTCAGALSGTTTVNAVAGVATFSTLQIAAAGTNCTLVASAAGLTPATSNAFNVLDPGFTFTSLSPDTGPTGGGTVVTILGSGFGTQIGRYQVIFGNANPAPPVTATRINASTLTVDTPAHPPGLVNVVVVDTTNGGTRALQNSYTYISQPAVKLLFGNQPSDIAAGGPFAPIVTVHVSDANGNVVTNATHAVQLSFSTNLAGGTLLGTTTVSAFNGVATFTNLSVDKLGTGYRLAAVAGGLTDAPPSNAFAVTAGAATQLAFGQPPTNNDPGVPLTPPITVEVQDQFGNLVPSSNAAVDMAIGINAGAGTLGGGTSVAADGGVATFNSLAIDKAGDGYTLVATSPGLTQVESPTFDVRFGSPARVTVTTHPGNGTAGAALSPAIVARVEDNLGNVVADFTGPVSVTIHTNPGGSTLAGTLTVNAVAGVATFSNVVLDKVGAAYRLSVNSFGLQPGITNAFDITNAAAAGLQFTVQPGDVSQGSVFGPAPEVRVVDAFGNPVPSATNAITMAIGTNPGGGVLGGTLVRNAVGGIAVFNDLAISLGGDGYTLTANATGLAGATSLAFNIIGVGGTFNIFAPTTPAGDIVGYLLPIVAAEDFCVDVVKIDDAGTAPANFTNITFTLQMIDSSVNTGSLQPGNCRSSWTVIQEWKGITAGPGNGSRVQVCAGMQGPIGSEVLTNLNEPDVWRNVRFRVFTTSGNQGTGCSSDAFSIRPDAFELTGIVVTDEDWQTAGTARNLILPGAASESGGPVHAAGRPFRVGVQAVNRLGQPTGRYDGAPTVEVLERLLPADCTGCPAPVVSTAGWGPASGVSGGVRSNQAVFNDVGSLRVRFVDATFGAVDQVDIDLGLITIDDTVILSGPVDIGRFVPDNFLVTPLNAPEFRTQGNGTCVGTRAFTYLGQQFPYTTLPQAMVSARSASGAVTPAYRNELWKLTPDGVVQEYTDNTVPADAAPLDTSQAPLLPGNESLISNNNGTGLLTLSGTDRLSYEREPLVAAGDPLQLPEPPLPFDAFITLTLRVQDDSEAGITGNAQINTGTPGVFANIPFDEGNEFRYGRARLVNSVGSELEPLVMPYRLQTWQDVGNGILAWVTETDDECTPVAPGDFTIQNVQDTGVGGLAPAITAVTSPVAAGEGTVTFGPQAPAVTGSFEVKGDGLPSYLQFNWTNDETGAEEGPTAKAAFGVNEGNPRRIFRNQSFIPRSN